MKDQSVVIAVIVSVGLVVSSALISSGLKSLGRGIQAAGSDLSQGISATQLQTGDSHPFVVKISDDGEPIRITTVNK